MKYIDFHYKMRYNEGTMSKPATESTISFTAPTEFKRRLQAMADDNGLTLSNLIRMSLTQALNKGVRIAPATEPSEYLEAAIREAEADYAAGTTTTIGSEAELRDYLAHLKG